MGCLAVWPFGTQAWEAGACGIGQWSRYFSPTFHTQADGSAVGSDRKAVGLEQRIIWGNQ